MKPLTVTLLAAYATLVSTGCRCISVPATDSTRPIATLRISWDNSAQVQYVNTTDHNNAITVNVPAGKTFTIAYSGSDDGGVKQLHVDYQFTGPIVNGVATSGHPLIAIDDFSSCAQTNHVVAKDFPYSPATAVRYVFSSSATDFKNNIANTPTITVNHGP